MVILHIFISVSFLNDILHVELSKLSSYVAYLNIAVRNIRLLRPFCCVQVVGRGHDFAGGVVEGGAVHQSLAALLTDLASEHTTTFASSLATRLHNLVEQQIIVSLTSCRLDGDPNA